MTRVDTWGTKSHLCRNVGQRIWRYAPSFLPTAGEGRGAELTSPLNLKWRHGLLLLLALGTRRRERGAVPFALPLHRSCPPLAVIYADSVPGNDDLSLPKGIAYYFLYIANIASSA